MKVMTIDDKVRLRAGEYRTTERLFGIGVQLISILCHERKNVLELAERLDVGGRTVRRYIEVLELMDIAIEKDFNGKYFIASDNCPICGHTIKEP